MRRNIAKRFIVILMMARKRSPRYQSVLKKGSGAQPWKLRRLGETLAANLPT